MTAIETPLEGPPPREIPLPHAPLARVIAQIRFPLIASVERRDFMAPFQEAIRAVYPVLRPEETRGVVLGPQGVAEVRANLAWRFHDHGGSWRVTLASEFISLETTRYSSREDFLQRFAEVLRALDRTISPTTIDRLGLRYIDRVIGDSRVAVASLVRPEVAGVMSTPLAAHARHSVTETLFTLPGQPGALKTRWGALPAQSTVDPAALDAIDEPSWILDIDAFSAHTQDFEVDAVIEQTRRFAERIYSFFRWAVTDEFLRRYGGIP